MTLPCAGAGGDGGVPWSWIIAFIIGIVLHRCYRNWRFTRHHYLTAIALRWSKGEVRFYEKAEAFWFVAMLWVSAFAVAFLAAALIGGGR